MCKACLYPLLAAVALLSACTVLPPPATPAGHLPPEPSVPAPAPPAPAPAPPSHPAPFYLGAASSALVAQAHAQSSAQDYPLAASTIERALRIEPGNPLLWIELGRIRLREGNAVQAAGLGRKALALATGDPSARSAAQRLIAEAQHGGTR